MSKFKAGDLVYFLPFGNGIYKLEEVVGSSCAVKICIDDKFRELFTADGKLFERDNAAAIFHATPKTQKLLEELHGIKLEDAPLIFFQPPTGQQQKVKDMNIDNLTLGQIKQIQALLGNTSTQSSDGLNAMIGKKVIIRTYSAGVWFGELEQKSGNEVILKNARRMWKWWAKEGISLSACAIHGVKHHESKIVEAVASVWLEAIEIIPCTGSAISSLESAPNAKAE